MRIFLKNKNIIFLMAGLFSMVLIVGLLLIFVMPKSYEYHYSNSTTIAFIHIFHKSIIKISIDPACEHEIQEGTPSPGFAVSYHYCDKRWLAKMLIESTIIDGDQKIHTLKYDEPGEKGDSYRDILVQTEESLIYNTQTYTRTSPLSIFRFITHR